MGQIFRIFLLLSTTIYLKTHINKRNKVFFFKFLLVYMVNKGIFVKKKVAKFKALFLGTNNLFCLLIGSQTRTYLGKVASISWDTCNYVKSLPHPQHWGLRGPIVLKFTIGFSIKNWRSSYSPEIKDFFCICLKKEKLKRENRI